ncbi:hemerythrin domain-containing protein [Candidatus Thioglobus sp.]|uniref:hemerythrin domain-containing protein n=1 Tax=Candidatus Thioglobus sp. TaxID=2026721 RepID=UPI003D108109
MKIAEELLALTRQHHTSLSLGNKCVNTAKTNDIEKINELCLTVSKNFKIDFTEHFETEERTIFSFLSVKSADLAQLCAQLTLEHQQLYKMAENLPNKPQTLAEFGTLLKTHTRTEDRQLFVNINLLSTQQRQTILAASNQHTSNANE